MNIIEQSITVSIFLWFLYNEFNTKYKYKFITWWYSSNSNLDNIESVNKESINLNKYDDL
jgi:hypothetical protein